MKNMFICALVLLVGVSCKTRGPGTNTSAKKPSNRNLEIWNYSYVTSRHMTEQQIMALNFYVSAEINFTGDFFSESTQVVEGSLILTDSNIVEYKTINRKEVGRVKEISNFGGTYLVSFSKKDVTYSLKFQIDPIGQFVVVEGATIARNGKIYNIAAQTTNCKLMLIIERKGGKSIIREEAEGDSNP